MTLKHVYLKGIFRCSDSILIVFRIYFMCAANDSGQETCCHGYQSQQFLCLLSFSSLSAA